MSQTPDRAEPTPPGPSEALRQANRLDTVLLIVALTLLTAISAYQFLGWPGLIGAVCFVAVLSAAAPHVPARAILRLYRAEPIDPRTGAEIYDLLGELCRRAGMARPPGLYVVPSLTMNAFSVGTPDNAAIAVTEGLLRKLSLRQTAGVLAHELSHIRNNDLRIMALADALSRAMQFLSWIALVLVLLYLPHYLAGNGRIPWTGLLLLYLAPTIATLLQLALSRTREFAADQSAVALTGDPAGLASALTAIERYEGRFWEDLIFPSTRRVPNPSILRTHPATHERIERLRALAPPPARQPIGLGADGPRVSLVGMSPSQMRPRYRVPGIWF